MRYRELRPLIAVEAERLFLALAKTARARTVAQRRDSSERNKVPRRVCPRQRQPRTRAFRATRRIRGPDDSTDGEAGDKPRQRAQS